MTLGYVFSRSDDKEFEIARASPGDIKTFYKKLYDLMKNYIFKNGGID